MPKNKVHKSSELSQLRKAEFEKFLRQDSISYSHPSKKYANKRFLRDTLEVTRKKYLAQSEFHTYGVISLSSMKTYRPANILLCGDTPLDQCLCDKCENCEQLLRALQAIGMKGIPSNRYHAVDKVVCPERHVQTGTGFSFPMNRCLTGECEMCGEKLLENVIQNENPTFFYDNRQISWRKWMSMEGKKAPQKCQVRGTVWSMQ